MKRVKDLVAEANTVVAHAPAAEMLGQEADAGVTFVDLRDPRELERDGMVPGAFHCPRGMLEFWIDPDCIYYKDIFASEKKFLFYCNLGWRSALAAQVSQHMGLAPVAAPCPAVDGAPLPAPVSAIRARRRHSGRIRAPDRPATTSGPGWDHPTGGWPGGDRHRAGRSTGPRHGADRQAGGRGGGDRGGRAAGA